MNEQFNLEAWLSAIITGLRSAFGSRLLFAAHAGSWVRGEAGPASDIDINIVLDEVRPEDLAAYRRLLAGMPFREKACGFICGRAEMRAWPRHELFHFMNGCNILHGSLDGIVAPPTKAEVAEYVRINASGVLHFARHTMIYSADLPGMAEGLAGVYKAAFFMLQARLFLETGKYVPSKKALAPLLDGLDREVFSTALKWGEMAEDRAKRPEHYFMQLADWSSELLLLADRHSHA